MMSRHLPFAIRSLPRCGAIGLVLAALGAVSLPALGADAAGPAASAPLDLMLRPALPEGPRAMQMQASSPSRGELLRERDRERTRERDRSRTGQAYGTGYEARHAAGGGAAERQEPARGGAAGGGRGRR